MKIVEFDKSEKDDFSENIKQLEDFIKQYQESGGNGFGCFYIDKTGRKLHRLFFWKNRNDLAVLGALELLKIDIIKTIERSNGDKSSPVA